MTQAEPELNIDTEDDGLIEVYSLTLHDQGELDQVMRLIRDTLLCRSGYRILRSVDWIRDGVNSWIVTHRWYVTMQPKKLRLMRKMRWRDRISWFLFRLSSYRSK